MLDFIYISLIGLSIICGLVFTKRSSHIAYKILLVFLIVTFCNEVMCYFLKSHLPTFIFYNIYYYFRFPVIGLIFHKIFGKKTKSINLFINTFYIISVPFFFLCIYLYKGLNKELHNIYLLTGILFVIINCLIFFYRSLRSEEIINPFDFTFFITTVGLFLYFLGCLPFLGTFNFMLKHYPSIIANRIIITKSLSIMLYSLISIDYYLQWKKAMT